MSSNNLPRLEVCLSPALLHLFDTKDAVVVIIDVFRATSTIAAALDNGATSIIPVASVQECIELGQQIENSITAGERNGQIAEGLEHGNSPSEYPKEFISGKTLVLTTTNGTRLLHMVEDAAEIVTGSFLNLSAVSDYLAGCNKNVLLACASWKDRFNLEDTLFAGAVVSNVADKFDINCDSTIAAQQLFQSIDIEHPIEFLRNGSHYKRLSVYGLESDMEYCTMIDKHNVLPILRDGKLVANSH
ncbi:MAG: 2-phosphosulfolactate phosphatase [Chitinophagales bacterium]|nr:2-phosphosulfolactate phosphatase [Chitinophagaceae bacterium]MCB9065146.1 2-phosphosulfolactate phosphatase [Chitinophagales bacterium]